MNSMRLIIWSYCVFKWYEHGNAVRGLKKTIAVVGMTTLSAYRRS